MSSSPAAWRANGAHESVAIAMQVEAAGDEVVARAAGVDLRGMLHMLAIELGQVAARGEAGQLLQQQAPLAAAAQAQFAHQLLVAGLGAGGAGDARDQFAIGHASRVQGAGSVPICSY